MASPRTGSKKADEKDLVTRLADAGEEALQRLTEIPGGKRALNALSELRGRVDELGRRVRGIEQLEERVAKLEKDVASLKKGKSPARRPATRKPPS